MTVQEAYRQSGGRPIQRLAWVQAPRMPMHPGEWAMGYCNGGMAVVLPRTAMVPRYGLTCEEMTALDWRPVPEGQEGVILTFLKSMTECSKERAGSRAWPRGL